MTDIVLKYNLLNKTAKQEVNDFIDFLLTKKSKSNNSTTNYKEKILKVSTWSEADVEEITKEMKKFQKLEVQNW